MKETVLFVSDNKYLNSEIKGGVQLCTREYIQYITSAGYDCTFYEIEPQINLPTRIKIKASIDAYERYNIKGYLYGLKDLINSRGVKKVFLNQLSIAGWAGQLRKYVGNDVKFIGLSHGNESADYVHEITKPGRPGKLQTFKLGKLIAREAEIFSNELDSVIVLTEQDVVINKWLGASKVLYLPRLLSPAYINWKPEIPNAGFAGTLDHLPNRLGVLMLANELKRLKFTHKLNLIGGPEDIGNELQQRHSFINYKGPVSDRNLIDEVSRWSVFINPVFWFARGASTKLAQAINWGIPCITTPTGRRGYELSNLEIVSVDDSPAAFAQMLVKALDNSNYLDKLQAAARQNAEEFNARPYIAALAEFLSA